MSKNATATHRSCVGIPHLHDPRSVTYDELLVGQIPRHGGEQVVAVALDRHESVALPGLSSAGEPFQSSSRSFRPFLY